ncbi:MAG: Mut7-C RNAse domain-containing protein [Chloroflexota bacterium]
MNAADSPTACEQVRLVADAMLGRLARWLRALGCDTVYDVRLDDAALARRARAEGRLLLTRDRQLVARKGLHSLLITSDHLADQLAQVLAHLPPPSLDCPGRCVVCNAVLSEVDKASVESRVPEYVWETQNEFTLCRQCGRIYWRGTHWQGILRQVAALKRSDD